MSQPSIYAVYDCVNLSFMVDLSVILFGKNRFRIDGYDEAVSFIG